MGSSSSYYLHYGFAADEANLQPHFLDSCSLCRRQLSQNCDIFMYRGNVPYCSQECRQEQIEIDEAIEKRRKLSSSSSSSSSSKRLNSVRQSKESTSTNNDVRTGTLVVA